MAQQQASSEHPDEPHYGDPRLAFSYLVSGAAIYGLIGWGLDRWLGTGFLVVVGILLGVALAIYMTFGRFGGLSPRQGQAEPRQERE
ncbi:AtpZ/AtpI family protein [Nocardioides sp. B-3]|uniref:AtpZ/AtpI family protein n=1 Tax=Nocardioides sp. B-3 TaxID=2895565 RepID=UPI0021529D3E|nr:AtpZ/AtpI family protein [Nocardioides sp. B-3]UUZ58352.1 AtpZ/AtpI family protein [Nocardioides sp. B-3]